MAYKIYNKWGFLILALETHSFLCGMRNWNFPPCIPNKEIETQHLSDFCGIHYKIYKYEKQKYSFCPPVTQSGVLDVGDVTHFKPIEKVNLDGYLSGSDHVCSYNLLECNHWS